MTDTDRNPANASTSAVRARNDRFRETFNGGRVVATAGIMALDDAARQRIFIAVQAFDAFDEGNDPVLAEPSHTWTREHDFGSIEAEGERVFFKIDYLAPGGSMHSEDPADPAKTERVMTIMLASEY